MARLKNALRGHFVGEFDPENPTTEPTAYLELAKWISTVGDDTDEETDDTGYYDGDGTKETTVIGVSGKYTFEGTYDGTDLAQKFIAEMKYKTGDGRKVWHKVVSADETKQWVGVATVTGIKAGSGDATAYESFNCEITYNQIPTESTVTP
jgi:hypothetical protein